MANILRLETAVVLGDLHIPYNDPVCESLALAIIADTKPAYVIQNGDMMDCPQISRHLKDPSKMNRFKQDRDTLDLWQVRLRKAAPTAKHVWIDGNHEDRWQKYLLTQAHEISDLDELAPVNIFHHKAHGIEWHKYKTLYKLWNNLIVHGDVARNISGASARAYLSKYGMSGVNNHIHREEQIIHRSVNELAYWYGLGCLCVDPDYMLHANWSRGIGVMYNAKHYERAHIQPVSFINGQAVLNGRGYEMEDAA
jgi:hypothetical protein